MTPRRKRKLLLHRDEIDKLIGKTKESGLTIIPLALYFKDGRAKVEIALAKGKKSYDHRQDLADPRRLTGDGARARAAPQGHGVAGLAGHRARARGHRLDPGVLLLDRGCVARSSSGCSGSRPGRCWRFLLWGQDALTRLSVGVVVVYATLIEYTFSGYLHVYIYRLHGSGLSACSTRCRASFRQVTGWSIWRPSCSAASCRGGRCRRRPIGVSAYALWGLFLSPQLDVLGALWAGCLLWWLWRGRDKRVYAAAFVVVTYLELLGTAIGTWRWQPHNPVFHWIATGNPPSGAAGGYCFFDAAALRSRR